VAGVYAYDLAPTAAELRRWRDLVRAAVTRLTTADQHAEAAAQ
jgi:hypothetical protein